MVKARTACNFDYCRRVINCDGCPKWTSNKEDAELPKANQSNVEVLPMKGMPLQQWVTNWC